MMKNNKGNASEETYTEYDTVNKSVTPSKLTVFSPVGLTNSKLNPIS